MDKFEEARKWAERTYPYYFKHSNAHPWSFNGIMADIQHALYNGNGLTRKDQNLEKRIDSLPESERRTALAELQKAERLYKGFFYKLTHGKKKPAKMDFSQMSTDEIERASEGLHR